MLSSLKPHPCGSNWSTGAPGNSSATAGGTTDHGKRSATTGKPHWPALGYARGRTSAPNFAHVPCARKVLAAVGCNNLFRQRRSKPLPWCSTHVAQAIAHPLHNHQGPWVSASAPTGSILGRDTGDDAPESLLHAPPCSWCSSCKPATPFPHTVAVHVRGIQQAFVWNVCCMTELDMLAAASCNPSICTTVDSHRGQGTPRLGAKEAVPPPAHMQQQSSLHDSHIHLVCTRLLTHWMGNTSAQEPSRQQRWRVAGVPP